VVFPRKKTTVAKTAGASNFPEIEDLMTLEGSWEVEFETTLGGPGEVRFDQLYDWSGSEDQGIRYYSGIARYSKGLSLPEMPEAGETCYLNLGEIHEMAGVKLNGVDLGVVWCAPWQLDITEALKPGENRLKIEVANLWPNRLIGDAALPEDERLTWTIEGHPYTANDKLFPSGLIGPVRIVIVD